jgi:hypothetical protein
MTPDIGLAGDNKRQFPRQRSGAACIFALDTGEIGATLLDASRGGFKLRFDRPDLAMAALHPIPRDIIIADQFTKMHATVMWASSGLAGCRFYQHLSLDDVVRMMTGHFRMHLAPLAPAEAPEAPDSGPQEPNS